MWGFLPGMWCLVFVSFTTFSPHFTRQPCWETSSSSRPIDISHGCFPPLLPWIKLDLRYARFAPCFKRTIVKWNKHGHQILFIPHHEPDPPICLTICMDVATNPGPTDRIHNGNSTHCRRPHNSTLNEQITAGTVLDPGCTYRYQLFFPT